MKIKFLAFLFVAVFTASYAQAQFKIGARAGLNLTTMSVDAEGVKMKPGFQIGVAGDYALGDAFSIQPAILFSTQGCKVDYKGEYMGVKVETKGAYHLNYIQLPVHAQYKIDLGGMKLLLQAGPYLGYGLGGKMNLENIRGGEKSSDKFDIKMGSSKDNQYKALDFGLGFGAGLQFGNLQVALGYQTGFVDLINSKWVEAQPVKIEHKKVNNSGFSLSLTCLFGK